MYFDLESFGAYIRDRRKSLNYTQKDVADMALVSTDTLRKIENGKVLANQATLEYLSAVLKEDLNFVLLKFRLDNYRNFSEKVNGIENKIENGNYLGLVEDAEDLKKILSTLNPYSYTYKHIKQLSLLVESIILKTINFQYEEALTKLIEALKLTTTTFSIDSYRNFSYSDMEVRILMNLALLENKLGNIDLCQDILIFSLNHLGDESIELKLGLIYNLANIFHMKGLNEKALAYANKGVALSIENNNLSILGLLYSRKGMTEFYLDDDNHLESLKIALTLHTIAGQNELRQNLLRVCKEKGVILN